MTAPAMTYNTLLDDVEQYADQHDATFVAQIPRLIMMCENRLASDPNIRGLGYKRFVNFDTANATSIYEKPSRWRATFELSIVLSSGRRKFLRSRGYAYLRVFWPDPTTTAEPRFYGDYDYTHFLIAPTPNAVYEAELGYYERPEPLDTSNQTNWTTTYAPQLLLYGTLLEAQPFLKRPDRISEFQMLFDKAVAALHGEGERRQGDQSNARTDG